ncbi:MAG TPA: hypothetical protein VGH82_08730 [Gaiellaceae bacterium]|jgi:Tol biopolymer transport system component
MIRPPWLWATAVVTCALLSVGHAAATPPGANGKLAFRRLFNSDHTWGAIFTSNPDGSGVRQITHPRRLVSDIKPDWSPDGRRIAFLRQSVNGCGPGCETTEIDTVGAEGAGLTRLAFDPPGKGCANGGPSRGGVCRGYPSWSPDGRQIAFPCDMAICVMQSDGTNVHPLTQTPTPGLADSDPQWSADRTHIAFDRTVRDQHSVFVMDADGGSQTQLTPWAMRAAQPDWSPDGKRIVFYSNFDGSPRVSANLYTINADGSALTQLTHAKGGTVQHLSASFSPDGRWIAFSRTPGVGRSGNADVFVMRTDGTHVRNVTRSSIWDSGVDWGPRLH